MLEWLGAWWPTLLICLGLAALVSGILWCLWREKKQGRSSCGGGCAGCPMHGSCHKR